MERSSPACKSGMIRFFVGYYVHHYNNYIFASLSKELNILVTNLERAVHGIKMYAEEKHVPESTLLRIKRAVEDALQL